MAISDLHPYLCTFKMELNVLPQKHFGVTPPKLLMCVCVCMHVWVSFTSKPILFYSMATSYYLTFIGHDFLN